MLVNDDRNRLRRCHHLFLEQRWNNEIGGLIGWQSPFSQQLLALFRGDRFPRFPLLDGAGDGFRRDFGPSDFLDGEGRAIEFSVDR